MVEKKHVDLLTEEEAAIYDRQIRLWGVEAQQRLRKAKVLLVGLSGLGNEVCKNILLAGIQHLTMLDDSVFTKEECALQFLSPQDNIGRNKAEASLSRAKELNPMVDIVADKDSVESKTEIYFQKFDVVCLTNCSANTQEKINGICHKHGIKFLSGNIFGYYGYMFADLGEHTYIDEKVKVLKSDNGEDGPSSAKKQKKENDTEIEYEEKTTSFCTFSDALEYSLFEGRTLREAKQVSKTYLVMKVALEYYRRHGCFPNQPKSNQELENILDLRNEVFEKLQIDNELLADDFATYCVGVLYPVNAIVGGVMAQEVIKAVSGKDAPHNNFFFYDGVLTSGIVEKISPVKENCKIPEEKPIQKNITEIIL